MHGLPNLGSRSLREENNCSPLAMSWRCPGTYQHHRYLTELPISRTRIKLFTVCICSHSGCARWIPQVWSVYFGAMVEERLQLDCKKVCKMKSTGLRYEFSATLSFLFRGFAAFCSFQNLFSNVLGCSQHVLACRVSICQQEIAEVLREVKTLASTCAPHTCGISSTVSFQYSFKKLRLDNLVRVFLQKLSSVQMEPLCPP